MNLVRTSGAFVRASAKQKRLAIEAAWELLRARILTLRPAAYYTRALGVMTDAEPTMVPALAREDADEIGHVVRIVARCMPFRALCLQQAIAVRRMLERRDIPALVYLGVARDNAGRSCAHEDRAAHAWVAVGSKVISGDGVLENYAIVARFA